MDDPKKKILESFDWKSFERFFGAKLPQIPTDNLNNSNWIENYVQDALKQAFQQDTDVHISSQKYKTELFDTHNNVVVKIHIPDKAQAKNIRVLVGANLVKLDGLPRNESQIIKLSTQVVESSCKAVYKKGILQLHIRKVSEDNDFYKASIRFFD